MINDADIARLFAERVAQPVLSSKRGETAGDIKESGRFRQYRSAGIFPSDLTDDEIASKIANYAVPGLSEWLSKLRQILVEANPTLSEASRQASILMVESYDPYTSVKKFTTNDCYIFIDVGLILFLWQMNKAYLSNEQTGRYSTDALATMTLAHHAMQLRPPEWIKDKRSTKHLLPSPKHPPPQDQFYYDMLLGLTIHHELFILAHEIAHIELGHLDPNWMPKGEIDLPITVSAFLANGITSNVRKEFEADDFALKLVVNLLGQGLEYSTEGTIVYLFQFSRYLLYIDMILREGNNINSDFIWAARHFHLRKTMTNYGRNIGGAIVDHSEILEEKLEPAMYNAMDLYLKIMQSKR